MDVDWKVGGTVYIVPADSRWRRPHTAVISKVGRKYATLGEGNNPLRADLATGRLGYSSGDCYYGTAWTSQEAYEAHKRLQEAWDGLRREIENKRSAPDGVTEENIMEARRLLFGG